MIVFSLSIFSIGPPGTAICAYRADDSMSNGGGGLNHGIFDIFRADLTVVMANGNTEERENTYVEVSAYAQSNRVLPLLPLSYLVFLSPCG